MKKIILVLTSLAFLCIPLSAAVRSNQELAADVQKAINGVQKIETAIDEKIWAWTTTPGVGKLQSAEVEAFIATGGAVEKPVDDAIALYAKVLGNLGAADPKDQAKLSAAIALSASLAQFIKGCTSVTDSTGKIKTALEGAKKKFDDATASK